MKLTIVAEFEGEFDGHTGTLTYTRENVETLEDLAHFYQKVATDLGFTYVIAAALRTRDKQVIWSSF